MAQPTYRLIEHTADVGVELDAPNLPELFALAARALFDIQVDLSQAKPTRSVAVQVTGSDLVDLLVAWLNELQFRFEADRLVFAEFDVQEVSDTAVRAVCRGEPYERARHGSKVLVKAVTYHMAAVEKRPDRWFARVLFDV